MTLHWPDNRLAHDQHTCTYGQVKMQIDNVYFLQGNKIQCLIAIISLLHH